MRMKMRIRKREGERVGREKKTDTSGGEKWKKKTNCEERQNRQTWKRVDGENHRGKEEESG